MPISDLSFIQLSDLHFEANMYDASLPRDSLGLARRALDDIGKLETPPAFFVISGDLANGEADPVPSYRRLKDFFGEIRSRFGVPVLLALGNHDDRAAFRNVILGQSNDDSPYYHAQAIGEVNVIVLDSMTPGKTRGALDTAQLAWLDEQLGKVAVGTAIVVLHHSPIPIAMRTFVPHQLTNARELEAVVIRHAAKILGILYGHIHITNVGLFGGVLCASAQGVAFGLDPSAQQGLRFTTDSGYNLVHIRGGQMVVNPIDLAGDVAELKYSKGEFE